MGKKQKGGGELVGDFGGYDSRTTDQFIKVWPKSDPSNYVYIFAHTWMDARSVALTYFKDEKGYNLGYDQLTGELLNEGAIAVQVGSVFLRKDPTGGHLAFEATREVDREGARRGDGIRKRKPVALEGGRPKPEVPHGVQANGQGVVPPHQGDAPRDQARGAEVGTQPDATTGVRTRTVGGDPVAGSSGANGAGK